MEEIIRPANRTVVLICGMLAMLSLGTTYFWSIFQYYLVETMGWSSQAASAPFSIIMIMYPIGTVIGGRLSEKIGPKAVLRIMGAGVLGGGMALCAVAVNMGPAVFYIVFAIMSVGSGAAYNSVLPAIQMWFPDRRGFAMGCVVSCAGAAGLVFSPFAEFWLNRVGAKGTFVAVGVAYIAIMLIASLGFDRPPAGWLPAGYTPKAATAGKNDMTTAEMLRTGKFFLLAGGMLTSILAYLMISPQIKSLAVERGLSLTVATATVMLCGLFNAGGRLLVSWASDKVGLRRILVILQIATVIGMVLISFAGGPLMVAMCFLLSFCYGGYLSVFPSLTSTLFGLKYAGSNYGCVLMSTILSAILAPVAMTGLTMVGGAQLPFFAGAASSLVAAILILSLREKKGNANLKAA